MTAPALTNKTVFEARHNGNMDVDTAVLMGRVYPTASHKGDLTVEILPNDPAAVMNDKRLAPQFATMSRLTKPDWHNMARQPEQLADALRERGVATDQIAGEVAKTQTLFAKHFADTSAADIRAHNRLFGMGTHVRFELADGSFDMMVKRTVPNGANANITLDPDRYACAGGMADDDLASAQIRELGEEAFILIDRDDHFEHVTLLPAGAHGQIDDNFRNTIRANKEARLAEIFNDPAVQENKAVIEYHAGKPVKHVTVPLHLVNVPEHMNTLTYTMPDGSGGAIPSLIVDDPVNGNLNVVSVGAVHMPTTLAKQFTVIDDEMQNPRRNWYMMRPREVREQSQAGRIKLASYSEAIAHDFPTFNRAIDKALGL